MNRRYPKCGILGQALGLLFSNCPGNWPFSSPQKPSCLLFDPPAGKNTDTHHDWTVKIRVNPPSLTLRWALLLTVAKVEWNKRFSKRFPSAKVSSKAAITQRNK